MSELASLFADALAEALRAVAVASVGFVESYAPETGRASVRPGVQTRVPARTADGDDSWVSEPVLPSVPVVWLGGGAFGVHAPLSAGDPVLLLVCDADPSAALRTGSVARPLDTRLHSLAHAIAIPLAKAPAHAEGEAMTAGHADAPVRFTSSGIEVDGSSDAAALASKVDSFGRALAILTNPSSAADALAVTQAVVTAAKNVWGAAALGSVASSKVKTGG